MPAERRVGKGKNKNKGAAKCKQKKEVTMQADMASIQ